MKASLHYLSAAFIGSLLLGSASCTSLSAKKETAGPRYVFFFLGDGMSATQIEAAAAFKSGNENTADVLLANRLHMTQLEAAGLSTTFCATRYITDSAAAATAFACGIKTRPGAIGRNAALDTSYKSIAELAQEQGRAIGIISSVSLSHATPAGYYANVDKRNSYCEIGYQAAQSGFEFFGGGLFPKLDSEKNSGGILLGQALEDAGYQTYTARDEILQLKDLQSGKIICSVATSYDGDAMPFTIDHPEEDFTLAEITQVAINYLQSDPEGFFIVVEGGKIDWACHGNDAATMVHEVIAFDDAVGTALAFLEDHPDDTLIVVTGDHETGGLSLGYRSTRYETDLSLLNGQTKSGGRFIAEDLATYRETHQWLSIEESHIDDDMKKLITTCFGIEWGKLSDYERRQLEKAYDASLGSVTSDDDYLEYGGTDPLTVTLTHLLANRAGLQWSTSSHTAVPIPVMASGNGATLFNGYYDNTDIAKKMACIMGFPTFPSVDTDRHGSSTF